MAKWAIDLDGVITANPSVWSWLTYHLKKNENGHEVYVLSWRDGSNPERAAETKEDLERFGIIYDVLVMAPRRLPNLRAAAFWKIGRVKKLKIDLWFDDELKIYKRDYGFDLDRLLPSVIKIWL